MKSTNVASSGKCSRVHVNERNGHRSKYNKTQRNNDNRKIGNLGRKEKSSDKIMCNKREENLHR